MKFGVIGRCQDRARNRCRPFSAAGHEVTRYLGRRDPSGRPDPVWGDIRVSSYEEMLADPDIDAVYNPLPSHLHVPMSIAALGSRQAGDLREACGALSVEELDRLAMVAARTGLYLYDGYMVRQAPSMGWLRRLDLGARLHVPLLSPIRHSPRAMYTQCMAAGAAGPSGTSAATRAGGDDAAGRRPRLVGCDDAAGGAGLACRTVGKRAWSTSMTDEVLTMSVSSGATLCCVGAADRRRRVGAPRHAVHPGGETTARAGRMRGTARRRFLAPAPKAQFRGLRPV